MVEHLTLNQRVAGSNPAGYIAPKIEKEGIDVMFQIILLVVGIVVTLSFLAWLRTLYVRVSPGEIAVLVGRGKKRILTTSGFRKPITEDVYRMSLEPIQVDVKTNDYIPTNDFIPIKVDSNVTVKIDTRGSLHDGDELKDTDGMNIGISAAVENFVGKEDINKYVKELIQDILEGNLREIIGRMTLEEMVTDRKAMADMVKDNAVPDLEGLGITIKTFNVQSFSDENGIINKLGAENEEEITKRAELVKTKAEEEKAIAVSVSQQKRHEAQTSTETSKAEQDQKLALQKAELEKERAKAEAEANASEEYEKAVQAKRIETEKAEVERIKSENKILLQENEAKANERIKIDNEFYAKQKETESMLAQAKAESEAIKLKGNAEAEAIEKRQQAMSKYSDADLRLKELEALVAISENIVKPFEKIGNLTMYSGSGTDFMSSMTQTMNQLTNSSEDSGFNLQSLINGAVATNLVGKREDVTVSENDSEDLSVTVNPDTVDEPKQS